MAKKSKETRIKEEKQRLMELFGDCRGGKLDLAEGLIDQAAFMSVTLDELSHEVSDKGYIEAYKHGENQQGIKASAALQAYNSTLKNYTVVMKQLFAIFPENRAGAKAKGENSLMKLLREKQRMDALTASGSD